jgi:hypothetical protein
MRLGLRTWLWVQGVEDFDGSELIFSIGRALGDGDCWLKASRGYDGLGI